MKLHWVIDKYEAYGRGGLVIQLLVHSRTVHHFIWLCRKFEVDIPCGVSVLGNWNFQDNTVKKWLYPPYCSHLSLPRLNSASHFFTTLQGEAPFSSFSSHVLVDLFGWDLEELVDDCTKAFSQWWLQFSFTHGNTQKYHKSEHILYWHIF